MLTKSNYINYLQCKKNLWLSKNRKDLYPEIDSNTQRVFDTGYEVENLAYKLYQNGVDVGDNDFMGAITRTKKLMIEKTSIIFQPSIMTKDLFCRSDILKYNKESDSWDIIEVKSTAEVKNVHIDDLAFQKICFEEAGFKIDKTILVHINNKYVKNGRIDHCKYLIQEDVTEQVCKKEDDTRQEIKNALKLLKLKEEPDVQVLKQCNIPYNCPFIDYCWKDFPEHSIYSIAGALGEKKLTELLDEGVMEIRDIPEEYLTNEKLQKHRKAVKHNIVHIEKENIKEEVKKIEYPVYFLDYETYAPAIPIINGYRPYQRIVFQYSLHVQEEEGGELKHYHFLAKDLKDPSEAMSKSLADIIGKKGSLIAWNMGFEKGCNTEMGERVLEYAKFYEDINERMYDLMHVFKQGCYVHKDFQNSASIKKVLPVLVPELSYSNLDINEGMLASNSWGDMVTKDMSQNKKDEIYNNLLDYCELDTLAMVKILEELNKI